VRKNQFVEAIKAQCDVEESDETRGAAHNLLPLICDFSFISSFFWGDILQDVNLAQKYMQTSGITQDMVATKLRALKVFLEQQRTNVVDNAVQQALAKCEELYIPKEKRIRRRRRMPGEEARDAGLSLQQETKRAMLECLDRFHIELDTGGKAVNDILLTFRAVQPGHIICANDEEIQLSVAKLTAAYDELSQEDLCLEIPRLRRHLQAAEIHLEAAKHWTVLQFLQLISKWDFVESLPYLTLTLSDNMCFCGIV
jgi:hypothetical protein